MLSRNDFGLKIVERMKRLGMNQSELARVAGVSPAAITQFIRHQRRPSRDVMIRIANALSVSLDYLAGTSDESEIEALLQSENVQRLIKTFIELPAEEQRRAIEMIELLAKTRKEEK